MAKTKISQFDATASNNTDLNSISVAEGTAPSNINNAIRELMSQLADLNLGNEVLSTLKIDNLHLDGNTIITLDTNGDLNLTPNGTGAVTIAKADINGGTIDGTPIGASSTSTGAFSTLSASSTANLGSTVTISGGNIDGVIGANTPAAITGTVITANTNFAGNLTGNVTGTVDGVVGGTTPAAVTGTTITANTKFVGAIDGNVTATSGTSTFNNVTINGTLDMDSTTSQTITGLATPSGSTDAATKGYVDTEVSGLVDSAPAALNTLNELAAALGDDASFSTTVTNSIAAKLPLAGGTMTGDIDANSNTVSGLKAPSASNDATTKTYVDTADALKLNLSGGTLSGNLAMGSNKVTGLDTPTATGDATTKGYVDGILGSATAAATSASAASTSQTAAATSATASATSATASASSATSAAASYDAFDDRFLGAKGSAPTVDNDGDALLTGALYFNTSSDQLFVWTSGDAWTQAAFTASGFLSGANNLSDVANAGTSRTNLGLGTAATTAATDYATAAQGTKADNAAAKASNLSDLASASTARTNLGLGSAATLTAGTSANNAVQLDGSAKLPAVDGSALTGLASGGTVNMVADGDIAIRKPVVLTVAGKAKEVATSVSDAAAGVGTALTLDSSVNGSDSRTVLVYMDGIGSGVKTFLKIFCDGGTSNHITAIAFTISDTGARTITAGTPVVVTSNDTSTMDAVFDPDTDRVIMVYRNGDASNQAYYSVISVSGTTVTASTVATLDNNNSIDARDLAITYDTSADRVAVVYYDQGDSGKVRSYVGTVTGGTTNSIAWGSNVDAEGAASNVFTRLCYDVATNRHLLVWRNDSGLQSKVGTLTGSSTNTLAWGSTTTLNSTSVADIELPMLTYEATQEKCVLGWFSGSSTQKFGVVTVTGASTNTAAIGSLVSVTIDYVLHEPNSNALSAIAASKVAYVYNVSDTVKVVPFTISGTSLSAGTAVTVASADTSNIQIAGVVATGAAAITFETNNVSINAIEYRSAAISGGGVSTTNLDNGNYLGVSAAAISDGATGKINVIGGTSTGHSSLTIGNHYFTNGAGAIGLVGNTFGEQYLGRAISATEIQLLENEGYLYGTAEGAVTAGKPVFVEADGDFLMPTSTTTTTTFSTGTRTEILAATINPVVANDFDVSAERFVAVYLDSANSNRTSAKLVTVGSDKAIAVTATQELTTTSYGMENSQIIYDPTAEKMLVVYKSGANSNDLRCKVLTIGATSITVGSEVIIDDANSSGSDVQLCYDTTNSKIIVFTKDGSNSDYPTAYVGSISGTTPSFGAGQVVNSEAVTEVHDCLFGNDNFLFTYEDSDNDGSARFATLSGTTLSFTTEFEWETNNPTDFNAKAQTACYDSVNDRFVITYKTGETDDPLYAKVLAKDGSTGTSGTRLLIGSSTNDKAGLLRKSNLGVVPVCYQQSTDIYYTELTVDASDNSLTKITGVVIMDSISGMQSALALDSTNTRLLNIVEDNLADDLDGVGIIPNSSITTTTFPTSGKGFIGIATKDVSDNGQVEVATTGQIDAQQSGLTAGETYYAQNDGSLGTSADTLGSVTVGKALSATKLLIQ